MPALQIGSKIGSYEILALVGMGGMGEVYRAHDTKLKRDVAIKTLPAEFSQDPEGLARAQREAELLASLNHPNIAQIYGQEEFGGSYCLVLEFVEGETLHERVRRGPISLDAALEIARQMAEALEAAHDCGIVHRDVKPANVKITPSGQVKLLDFGLAKLRAGEASRSTPLSNSPTMAPSGTLDGVILGTAAYMAPEQAKGEAADARSDIWAFGVVVYEMLTGKSAFRGETMVEVLGGVLKTDPDWTALPSTTPPIVRSLLRRCLQKDRKHRLRHMADARLEIEEALHEPAAALAVPPMRASRKRLVWILPAILLIATTIAATVYVRRVPEETHATRFTILPPEGVMFLTDAASISPDGRLVVFVAQSAEGRWMLWVRPLDSLIAKPLLGTESALLPFWSPDSRSIGFFAGGKLKRIDMAGGPPIEICDLAQGFTGGTWSPDGVILFGSGRGRQGAPLLRVAAAGGTPSPATTLDKSRGEISHREPHFLPDGRHFIYTSDSQGQPAIFVAALDSSSPEVLVRGGSSGIYSPPGSHLLFIRGRTLMAQPFDAAKLTLTSEAFSVAEDVASHSVSWNGTLTYRTGNDYGSNQLMWFDRNGKQIGAVGASADYRSLDLSSNGMRIIAHRFDTRSLWLFESMRASPTPFTLESAQYSAPVWSPDGTKVAFHSDREGVTGLYQKDSSGAGSDELLWKSPEGKLPTQWSFDSRFIVYESFAGATGTGAPADLWLLPTVGDRTPTPFLQSKFSELHGQFSPDGRWIAYTSNEIENTFQVYVQPFPTTGAKWQVSTTDGGHPRWNPDGKELFYASANGTLMAVAVRSNDRTFDHDPPKPLFQARLFGGPQVIFNTYSVSPDGQRFLMITTDDRSSAPVTVVQNWTASLKK